MKRQNPKTITPNQREQITTGAKFGLTDDQICDLTGVTIGNLRKHCAEDLAKGRAQSLLFVGEKLFDQIKGFSDREGEYHAPSLPAIIFYLKTRGGWHELQGSAAPTNEEDHTPASIVIVQKLKNLKSKNKTRSPKKAKK